MLLNWLQRLLCAVSATSDGCSHNDQWVRLPAWGFLSVFYNNDMWQTDRWITALYNKEVFSLVSIQPWQMLVSTSAICRQQQSYSHFMACHHSLTTCHNMLSSCVHHKLIWYWNGSFSAHRLPSDYLTLYWKKIQYLQSYGHFSPEPSQSPYLQKYHYMVHRPSQVLSAKFNWQPLPTYYTKRPPLCTTGQAS